jgi:ribonuclease E
VWLPSGGSLVIDSTEAMTVVDVNTGKFTGQGGNLEETVTRNNLEAAEEIVRQLRLRDVGGIIVIDFIDMVLESNRELVLRRLLECLARDRTKHQVAEVTSLGLVQMTRKRVGSGLLEAFSEPCECCNGRGVIVSLDLIDRPSGRGRGEGRGAKENRQSKNGKNGKESGRRTAGPATAGGDEDSGTRDTAPGEAGADAAAGPEADGPGADGTGGRPSGGRRRRRAATREQGPPEPDAASPDGPASDAQELSAQIPDVPKAQASESGAGGPIAGGPAASESAAGRPAPGRPAPGSLMPENPLLGRPAPGSLVPGRYRAPMRPASRHPTPPHWTARRAAPRRPATRPWTGRPHNEQRAELRATSDNLAHRMDTGWGTPRPAGC